MLTSACEETSKPISCLICVALLLVQSITDILSLSITHFQNTAGKKTLSWFLIPAPHIARGRSPGSAELPAHTPVFRYTESTQQTPRCPDNSPPPSTSGPAHRPRYTPPAHTPAARQTGPAPSADSLCQAADSLSDSASHSC